MRTYSIGRDQGCNIVISDSTDVVSRCHALLNVTSMGKMFIIDQSTNGTYVNGIKITPRTPVPVTRRDIISFAHVAQLDWNKVPRSAEWAKYAITIGAIVIIAIGGVVGYRHFSPNKGKNDAPKTQVDSAVAKTRPTSKKDSTKNVEGQKDVQKNTSKKAIKNRKRNTSTTNAKSVEQKSVKQKKVVKPTDKKNKTDKKSETQHQIG
jgi:pSer/pThr/pTyr-binding forkhead associated (FHA) protein